MKGKVRCERFLPTLSHKNLEKHQGLGMPGLQLGCFELSKLHRFS
jgi:hypothetical protein